MFEGDLLLERFTYRLKNFKWQGTLEFEDVTLHEDRLDIQAETLEQAELSASIVLDLISFYRDKDVYIHTACHDHVDQANKTRMYTGEQLPARMIEPDEMRLFLQDAYLRYRDSGFRNQTGVEWGLRMYLCALGTEFFQAKFLTLFAALEILLSHVTPPAAEGPLAGLIHAVRKIPSIPSGTREVAAARLAAPSLAERMVEFVRFVGLKGVAFQRGDTEEVQYRFDELLRIKEEFSKKGVATRFSEEGGHIKLHNYFGQMRELVRESLLLLLTRL